MRYIHSESVPNFSYTLFGVSFSSPFSGSKCRFSSIKGEICFCCFAWFLIIVSWNVFYMSVMIATVYFGGLVMI